MADNLDHTFDDMQRALEYMRIYNKRTLTDEERNEWQESLKELQEEIPLQIKRQDISAKALFKRII